MSTIDLSEPHGLSLFRVLRGGIETIECPLDGVRGRQVKQILTLDPYRLRSCRLCLFGFRRQWIRNGYVVALSFFGLKGFPFFHSVKATVAIFRATMSRAFSGRMPFFWSASRSSARNDGDRRTWLRG